MRKLTMPHKNMKLLNNSRGNTILAVLCLIAVSVAAFQISLSNSIAVNGGIKNSRILSARDSLELRIKSYSSLGTTIRSSMHSGLPTTVNPELRNCIFGTGPNPCMPVIKNPVALYYPIYSTDTGGTTIRRISGPGTGTLPANQSAFYDNKGNLCIANSTGSLDANCPFFEVTTTFVAKCAGGASSCTTADSISVNYVIKAPGILSGSASQSFGSFSMATIDLAAPDISISSILPAAPGSSSNNIITSLLPTENTLSLDSIKSTLQSLGIDDSKLDEYALDFQQSGINDLSKIPFLIQVGQPDPTWMRLVVDSGITNANLAGELYWAQDPKNPWTPTQLAAVAAAVQNVTVPAVATAIAGMGITDPAVATQIANAVSSVSNPNVAAGIIAGGYYTDPVKVAKISSALSQIANPYAEYLAQAGVTDSTVASQIVSVVSVLDNPYGAGWIIVAGGGNVTKTQNILNDNLNSTWTPGTPETTTTTTVIAPTPTPAPLPVEISLMPSCSACEPVTY